MKLVGSYTSPFVRKLSILLLEKGITFEFINELPYNADNGVAQFTITCYQLQAFIWNVFFVRPLLIHNSRFFNL